MQHEPRPDGSRRTDGHAAGATLALAPDPGARRGLRGGLRAHMQEWGDVWAVALASRIGVLVVGFLAQYAASSRGVGHWIGFARSGTYIHYADVVHHGYTAANATEYPLLPMVMGAGHAVGIPLAASALLFTNLCFLLGLACFGMLGARYVGLDAARTAAIYLAVFPTSHFFSIASSEAPMLLLMCGVVLLALRGTAGSWLAAAPLAALCALTRPPGMLVGIVLAAIAIGQLRDGRLRGAGIAAAIACGAAIPAAVLVFFAWLRSSTGDPLAAVHAQKQYGRSMSLTGPYHAVTGAAHDVVVGHQLGVAFELAAAALIAGCITWYALRAAGSRWEIGGWTAFAAASFLMPLATGIVWQMPRFALLVPPVFWMLGRVGLRHPRVHAGLMVLLPMALAFKVVFEVVGVTQ